MLQTRHLLREDITYSLAKEREANILHQLGFLNQHCLFFSDPYTKRDWMKAVVAHQLNLSSKDVCHVATIEDWLCGSFNVPRFASP